MPRVSIVIATYNWSEALACAARSVALQTFQDYEVLVTGDACTDDSASVVERMGDPRFHWINRETNAGSQWAPNNDAIARSSAEYIAYLGHDDLWYPTHLESLVRAAASANADVACAVTLMYGPEGSGVRNVCGVLADGLMDERQFVVPSSILHRRSLLDRIGPWRDPASLKLPTDCDLILRAVHVGAVFVPTNELSVFKFNAAWRRDAYGRRDSADQRAMLARIESGTDFRQEELIELVRASISQRSTEVRMPDPSDSYAKTVRAVKIYKGVLGLGDSIEPLRVARRFSAQLEQLPSFEWYRAEGPDESRMFRWSGPCDRSTVQFPVSIASGDEICVDIVGFARPETLRGLQVEIQGQSARHLLEPKGDGTYALRIRSEQPTPGGKPLTLSFKVSRTTPMPADMDRRPRGIAFRAVDLVPRGCPPESAKLPALPPMWPAEAEPSSSPKHTVAKLRGRLSAWTRYFKRSRTA